MVSTAGWYCTRVYLGFDISYIFKIIANLAQNIHNTQLHIQLIIFNCIVPEQIMDDFKNNLLAGTVSGVGNCLFGYVFDTLKVRMQMDSNLSFRKAIQMARNQQFIRLFDGIYYPFVTVPVVNAVVFAAYEGYKQIRGKTQLSFTDGIQNGVFAGLVNTVIVSPVELIKCKLQSDFKTKEFKGSKHCLLHILETEGFFGIFRGFFSTAFREVFAYGAQFAAYECLKKRIISEDHLQLSFTESLGVGVVAGINCWIFSYPQDIVKTRLQVMPAGTFKKWGFDGGFFDCSFQIYRIEGIKGFWVGISPCLIRAAVANGVGIAIYEKVMQNLKRQW